MKRKYLALALIIILAPISFCDESSEWTVLFNGKNLKHWEKVEGGEWKIEDDVLIGRNGQNWTTNPEKTGSYLRSKKMYADFILEFDYAIAPRSNSGVFLRCAKEKNPAFTGYEMQITDCHGKKVSQYNAGLYDVVAPLKNLAKPAGEFNQVRIKAKGQTYTIFMNGKKYLEYKGERRKKGFIGLQNHDKRSVVKFRDIRIKELKES